MRFDLWQSERESAEVVDHGIRVRRDGRVAMIWNPKATKPTVHIAFRDEARRDEYIQTYISRFGERLDAKNADRKKASATAKEKAATVDVGHIFCYSWGYDQTNVDYFQVVEKHGQTLTLRAIAASTVPGSEGMMCDRVEPRIGRFLAKTITKRLRFTSDGRAYLSFEYGWCELWRGGDHYRSWYA